MRERLGRIRVLRRARRAVVRLWRASNRYVGPYRLKRALARSPHDRKIVIGAASRYDAGWIPTNQEVLDLVEPSHWDRYFQPGSVDAMLAEHVWEHLTPEEAAIAVRTCFKYLRPGGYLRVAVPDGLHPSQTYLDWVKVGGALPGRTGNDHKVLYTYRTLRELFERSGFRVHLYEYFDEAGKFHFKEWDRKAGTIWRSKRFDRRNRNGDLTYTSIVMDAYKD